MERVNGGKVFIDRVKLESEACCEGKYLLAINAPLKDLLTADVALRYKELWQVENIYQAMVSALQTHLIYHQNEDTIKWHVFCSFLALILLKELQMRINGRGWKREWYLPAEKIIFFFLTLSFFLRKFHKIILLIY